MINKQYPVTQHIRNLGGEPIPSMSICNAGPISRRPINSTNNLPLRLIPLHRLMRLHNLLPRQHPIDMTLKLPAPQPLQRLLLEQIPQPALILRIPAPQRAPFEPRPLHQQRPNVHPVRQLRAPHCPELHDPPVARQHLEVLREVGGTHEVDDQVYAVAVVELLDLVGPAAVVLGGVDGAGGVESVHAEVALGVLAGCCEDFRGWGLGCG